MYVHSFKSGREQQGVAMVEFAIALPLLLLLLLGIAEFGRMLYQYNSLLQASRDAGRFVAGKAWNATLGQVVLTSNLQTQAKNLAVYGLPNNPGCNVEVAGCALVTGLNTANVQVTPVGTEHVQVSINFTFRPVIGTGLPALIGDAIPLNFPLVATTVMRGL
jgi:Flp pilus assembly protein TadG